MTAKAKITWTEQYSIDFLNDDAKARVWISIEFRCLKNSGYKKRCSIYVEYIELVNIFWMNDFAFRNAESHLIAKVISIATDRKNTWITYVDYTVQYSIWLIKWVFHLFHPKMKSNQFLEILYLLRARAVTSQGNN